MAEGEGVLVSPRSRARCATRAGWEAEAAACSGNSHQKEFVLPVAGGWVVISVWTYTFSLTSKFLHFRWKGQSLYNHSNIVTAAGLWVMWERSKTFPSSARGQGWGLGPATLPKLLVMLRGRRLAFLHFSNAVSKRSVGCRLTADLMNILVAALF